MPVRHQRVRQLVPDCPRRTQHQCQLGTFIRFGDRISRNRGGKPALRTGRQPVESDEARRFRDTAFERVGAFQRRDLAADKPEHPACERDD